jgi:hypothetical protein
MYRITHENIEEQTPAAEGRDDGREIKQIAPSSLLLVDWRLLASSPNLGVTLEV